MASFLNLPDFDIWDVLGAGATAVGGFMKAGARSDAAKAQERANQQAIAQQAPYAGLGQYGAGQLQRSLNALGKPFTLADLQDDPGYQFRLQEGERAIDRKKNARGSLYGIGTLRAGQRYGQGLAADEFQSAWARDDAEKRRRYNMLAGTIGAGQNAAGATGRYLGNIGDAQAASRIGRAGDIYGGVSDALNALDESRYRNDFLNILRVPT